METARTRELVNHAWDQDIVPALTDYIRIPNQSPAFDPAWEEHGHMTRAVALAQRWVAARDLPGSRLNVIQLQGRTPVLLLEVPGTRPGNVLLYGHLDKQPPFSGWRTQDGLGPWTPKMIGQRLYGRGGADDGYAVFASVAALEALIRQGVPTPRAVILIECSEESGSPDLPAYIEALEAEIGRPDLVVCLDSGCGDYDRLWQTTSLRGNLVGVLRVDVLREGVHSGSASGVVASSFRVARILMDRIEEASTGRILVPELHVAIPDERGAQAQEAAALLGPELRTLPYVPGMQPVTEDTAELLLNRTWRPTLSVTGQAGLPDLRGGNVLRTHTALKLSLRLPPTLDASVALEALRGVLLRDPPYGAAVTFEHETPASGWAAPPTAPWLAAAVREASTRYYGAPAAAMGEGGTIPFMGMLGEKFPEAQFLITGVLGPESNAHGPNEFLDVAYAKSLTCCVAHVLAEMG